MDSLLRGEGKSPELVETFHRVLFGGPNMEAHSESVRRRATCAGEDALFIVRNGRVMPRKHILLSMLIKSLTGSREILTVLNKFGYGISYSKEEELETELASAIIEKDKCAPDGTAHSLVMGNAWDNYDELTHTLSGSDTLHDTMGILYQNQPLLVEEIENPDPRIRTVHQPTVTAPNVTLSMSSAGSSKRKMKRKLVLPPTEIPPYRKKTEDGYVRLHTH